MRERNWEMGKGMGIGCLNRIFFYKKRVASSAVSSASPTVGRTMQPCCISSAEDASGADYGFSVVREGTVSDEGAEDVLSGLSSTPLWMALVTCE